MFFLVLFVDRIVLPFFGVETDFLSVRYIAISTLTTMFVGWLIRRPLKDEGNNKT